MSRTILFASTPKDEEQLIALFESLGLLRIPMVRELTPYDGRGGYLSSLAENELQVWGDPPRYQDVLDPLLRFRFSDIQPGYLRPGRIEQNLDSDVMASKTRLTFDRIARWIRKNWPKPNGIFEYCGPDAANIIRNQGLMVTDLVPGTAITYVPIDREGPIFEVKY